MPAAETAPPPAEHNRCAGRGAFAFEHFLTRDAAYRALLASNRRALHSAAAEALAAQLMRGAPDELSRLAQLADHLERAQAWQAAHEYYCALLTRRVALGQLAGWTASAGHAAQLWQQARTAQPALPPLAARESNAWALYHTKVGEMEAAQQRAAEALALARAEGDAGQTAAAQLSCGLALHYAGGQHKALSYYEAALAAYRQLVDRTGETRALNCLGLALHELGRSAEALPFLQAGLALAQQQGHLQMEASLAQNLAIALSEEGHADLARAHFLQAQAAAVAIGDRSTESHATGNLGDMAADAGQLDEARPLFGRALAMAEEVGAPRYIAWWQGKLAELEQRAGQPAEARERIRLALLHADRSGDKVIRLQGLILAAEIELAAGERTAAGRFVADVAALANETVALAHPRFVAQLAELRQRLAELEQLPGPALP